MFFFYYLTFLEKSLLIEVDVRLLFPYNDRPLSSSSFLQSRTNWSLELRIINSTHCNMFDKLKTRCQRRRYLTEITMGGISTNNINFIIYKHLIILIVGREFFVIPHIRYFLKSLRWVLYNKTIRLMKFDSYEPLTIYVLLRKRLEEDRRISIQEVFLELTHLREGSLE